MHLNGASPMKLHQGYKACSKKNPTVFKLPDYKNILQINNCKSYPSSLQSPPFPSPSGEIEGASILLH